MTRRLFLTTAGAATCLAADSRWMLGANTAIQGYGLYAAIELIRQLQFPVIEIHTMGTPAATPKAFPGFRFDELSAAEKGKVRSALKGFRQVTAHLPYSGLNWLSRDAAERLKAVRTIDVALEGAAYFGVHLAVLHPQSLPGEPWKPREPEYLDAIGRWADRGARLGVRLALETGFAASVADFVNFIQRLNHANVGATIDVGHQSRYSDLSRIKPEDRSKPASIKAYNDTTLAIIGGLGSKVFHLHVHDIDPETWAEHKPLVHGFVDYPRLLAKLGEVGFRGCLVLEIGGDPDKMPGYLRDARDKFRRWLS